MAKKLKKRRKGKPAEFRQIQPNAAGIDVGAYEVFVAVPEGRSQECVRSFETFTEDLEAMARWLLDCQIDTVAMESTGVYWIPVYQILEAHGLEVCLVNARHVKNVPGRKTDVLDCQWLQYLHSVGLLRASFRPSGEVVAIRTLLRHRERLVQSAAMQVQHMQKSLTQMNLYLHNVISNITGKTGMAILEAIVAGERDPYVLAKLRDRRIKADAATIAKSLVGDYRPEHLFTLKQAMELYGHIQESIQACDRQIEEMLESFEGPSDSEDTTEERTEEPKDKNTLFDLRSRLHQIYGVDLIEVPGISTLTAHTIFTEIGLEIHRFKTAHHFSSWLGLSPNNKVSGGKVLSSKTSFSSNRLAKAFRLAANSLYRNQSYLGDYFRKMRARHGAPKAITATAHKLARIIYSMLKNRTPYDESVFAAEQEKARERQLKRLKKQAENLGLVLVENPANVEPSLC